ncbi:MAG: phosphoribosylamine--glycine ligase [Sulfuricurvum sp. PC08-66]|nr:MAG: phosphoribosylamine--glycine ligase [Sulfuricurvum sp. PC08-66]
MKVLVVGSGGREFSIGLALSKDRAVSHLYFAPGNGATSMLGANVAYESYEALLAYVQQNGIDLTIVGPEQPLVEGIVDIFRAANATIFGPTAAAARLEGSKVYMKNFLAKYAIPTAAYIETDSIEKAYKFIDAMKSTPIVVKADGLCGGKGVIIAQSKDEAKRSVGEMLSGVAFGEAGKKVIVEEYLDGYELSMFAICDGKDYILLPAAQDHKRIGDGDTGPNTGGMGAYAPTPLVDETLYTKVKKRVIEPTLIGMQKEGAPFEGVLFIGVMVVAGEPIVLEYNVRFGDPECEILMPLMTTPASELFYKAATKSLDALQVTFSSQYAVGVVMASANYPYGNSQSAQIIVDEVHHEELAHNAHISYAGVSEVDGMLMATGGRVLVCVGLGDTIQQARDRAYLMAGQVHFAGKKMRTDIAYQALRIQ